MTTAAVIGLGGLGCPAAVSLLEGGVDCVRLLDDDAVSLSNLQRQVLFGTADVGRRKVDVAAERLGALFGPASVERVPVRLGAENADSVLDGVDVVVDATDDPAARFVINDWALAHGVGCVLGGVNRFYGLVLAVAPNHGPCFRCLFEDAPTEDIATCGQAGVLGALCGIVGHMQAERALGLLAGEAARHTGFVTTIDGLSGRLRHVPLPEATQCPACGGVAQRLDITHDACPITLVRTKLALDELVPGTLLDVLMRQGEPARNVPRSLREEGHEVLCAGGVDDDHYRVVVRRAPPRTNMAHNQ